MKMRFTTVARSEKMGSYSRGQSMDSIYRIKAFSDKKKKKSLPVDLVLRALPSFIILFGSYSSPV